ncbi:response regulator transcription factor [Bacillus sp. CLL-7-23]|uniref:Response regulator transcription factor n=1 Tax=Bacillus changyiensis TaxID=3004103 RepID=A0ABT4X288_9BACI|nr:response regulator transcription factor [Bacillus changyiensis]MDA7026420.1 response regulator transcription factor [Bacillus changyiensis]
MKVMIVDDEESILNLIRLQLELEGFEVIMAQNGKQALEGLHDLPDMMILDLMLPDIDGFELLRKVREKCPHIPIIMLTAKNQMNDKIIGLQLGADDYMTKPFNSIELSLRIKNLLKRIHQVQEKTMSPLTAGSLTILETERKVLVHDKEIKLTYREFNLLSLLVKHKRRVFSREELLESIWGFEFIGHTRAVDIMVQRLRKKLGNEGTKIKTIYGIGYKLEI